MRNVLLIIRREFLERVRTRAFVLGTVLFPLFMLAMVFLPGLLQSGGGKRTLVMVDESPAGVGARVAEALQAPNPDKKAIHYTVQRVPGPLDPQRARLNAQVQNKKIDGYLWIGPQVLQSNQVAYRAKDVTNVRVVEDLERATTAAVQQVRLRDSGLTAAQVAALVKGVDVQAARITGEGEEGGNLFATLITSYVLGIMFLQLIAVYGQSSMRSVLEEKNNRIVEVIASSVRATHLLAGKVLGLAAVAVLQIGIWVGFSLLLTSQRALLESKFGISAAGFSALQLKPAVWAVLLMFFALGFVLYAAVYAAAGSAVTTEQEAQQMAMPLMLPLLVPIMFIQSVLMDPLGTTARVLSMIPFTAPIVMPMRVVATDIPAGEIALSVALLVVGTLAVMWLAGKIYRIGILSTGKKPSLREIGRWLRAA